MSIVGAGSFDVYWRISGKQDHASKDKGGKISNSNGVGS